jgi:hypothetical protein
MMVLYKWFCAFATYYQLGINSRQRCWDCYMWKLLTTQLKRATRVVIFLVFFLDNYPDSWLFMNQETQYELNNESRKDYESNYECKKYIHSETPPFLSFPQAKPSPSCSPIDETYNYNPPSSSYLSKKIFPSTSMRWQYVMEIYFF